MSYRDELNRKLYQLIIRRIDGPMAVNAEYRDKIFEHIDSGIGGFIFFGGAACELKPFIKVLRSKADIPLFIASDIERGVGQQIDDYTALPCQMALSSAVGFKYDCNLKLIDDFLNVLASEAADAGINMPLLPVADTNTNPDNPIICTRSFSDDPKRVAIFTSQFIKNLEDRGFITCAKHFPGHGSTSVDSHIELPELRKNLSELRALDMIPFIKALESGVSSIMTGHLLAPEIDFRPASLSKTITTDILRNDLGFKGLILTDALNMNALDNIENIDVKCMEAGADILLHPVDPDRTVNSLESALKNGRIDEETIDIAYNRILSVKQSKPNLTKDVVDFTKHLKISEDISEKSIVLITKGDKPFKPIDCKNFDLLFVGEESFCRYSPLKESFGNIRTFEDLENNASTGSLVIALFSSVVPWKGDSGIAGAERSRLEKILDKMSTSIVISFGSPYMLGFTERADYMIAAFEATGQAQKAVLRCLKGDIGFKGTLPVKVFQ